MRDKFVPSKKQQWEQKYYLNINVILCVPTVPTEK